MSCLSRHSSTTGRSVGKVENSIKLINTRFCPFRSLNHVIHGINQVPSRPPLPLILLHSFLANRLPVQVEDQMEPMYTPRERIHCHHPIVIDVECPTTDDVPSLPNGRAYDSMENYAKIVFAVVAAVVPALSFRDTVARHSSMESFVAADYLRLLTVVVVVTTNRHVLNSNGMVDQCYFVDSMASVAFDCSSSFEVNLLLSHRHRRPD